MHSHHSHSGQYVQHAKDTLDEVVQSAITKNFATFCLTEHMPRYFTPDLYDEEIESKTTPTDLIQVFDTYYNHAKRIQEKVNNDQSNRTQILVGFESEGISDLYHEKTVLLKKNYKFDLVVGSVHHVHRVPIDYDRPRWEQAARISVANANARVLAHGNETTSSVTTADPENVSDLVLTRALYNDYFDLQYSMLQQTQPSIVGHFDLIRLFAKNPASSTNNDQQTDATTTNTSSDTTSDSTASNSNATAKSNNTTPIAAPSAISEDTEMLETQWPEVWFKIIRNIEYAVSINALFELNSAAIRKGWNTPYPRSDIANLIIKLGGKFCLSDDSHGIAQVGLNLHKCVDYLEKLKVEKLYYLALEDDKTVIKSLSLAEVKADFFWDQYYM